MKMWSGKRSGLPKSSLVPRPFALIAEPPTLIIADGLGTRLSKSRTDEASARFNPSINPGGQEDQQRSPLEAPACIRVITSHL